MDDMKAFQVRLPREIWVFLKKKAAEGDISMANIIIDCLTKYKKKCEKGVDRI